MHWKMEEENYTGKDQFDKEKKHHENKKMETNKPAAGE